VPLPIPPEVLIERIQIQAAEQDGKPPTCKAFRTRWHSMPCATVKRLGGWTALVERALSSEPVANGDHPHEGTPNWREWANAAEQMQSLQDRAFNTPQYRELGNRDLDAPQVVMFTSCWHLGAKECRYDWFRQTHDYLCALPKDRVKEIVLGDYIENTWCSFRSARAVFDQTIPPQFQRDMLRSILEERKDYIAAATWGNHCVIRDEAQRGWSDVAVMLNNHVPYFDGKGWLDWWVGGQKYRMYLTHIGKGGSIYHPFQDLLRAVREETHFDIGASGHVHNPGAMWFVPATEPDGRPVDTVLIKAGAFKPNDIYSTRHFKPGVLMLPSVVLMPDRHEVVGPFQWLHQALEYAGIKAPKPKPKIYDLSKDAGLD